MINGSLDYNQISKSNGIVVCLPQDGGSHKFDELDIIQDSMVYLDEQTNQLVIQVYPRMVELAKLQLANPDEYIKQEVNKVNNSLPSFMRVSRIIIRKEDFVRTPAMKIIRGKANQ